MITLRDVDHLVNESERLAQEILAGCAELRALREAFGQAGDGDLVIDGDRSLRPLRRGPRPVGLPQSSGPGVAGPLVGADGRRPPGDGLTRHEPAGHLPHLSSVASNTTSPPRAA